MATVGFSEAARLAGVSRQHLYRLAESGELAVITEILPDEPGKSRKTIAMAELERVFDLRTAPDNNPDNPRQLWTVPDNSCDSSGQPRTVHVTTPDNLCDNSGQLRTTHVTTPDSPCDSDYKLLQIELEAVRRLLADREQQLLAARSREEWLKTQIQQAQSITKLLQSTPAAESSEFVPSEKYRQMVDAAKQRIFELRREVDYLKNRGFLARLFNF